MTAAPPSNQAFLDLLRLEKEARQAADPEAFALLAVNRARLLVPFAQAALVRGEGPRARVLAVSDVAVIDRDAPFVRWLGRVAGRIAAAGGNGGISRVDPGRLPERERAEWSEWLPAHALWCPLRTADGRPLGGLWLSRDAPFADPELLLLDHLCEAWGHAWAALLGPRAVARRGRWRKAAAWGGALLALAAQVVPVPQSVLAPAEVVARRPTVVSAPMDGVVRTIAVAPNAEVAAGDLLLSYERTILDGRLEVADEELAIARTELKTARQAAFQDPRSKADVAVLEARVALRTAERDHILAQVARVDVRAERGGVAVFRDPADLEGLPVETGQRLMLLADPLDTELRVELPVADAVAFPDRAPVRLFLDRDPLRPVDAVLEHMSYEAIATPAGTLAYRMDARFAEGRERPRLGLRGTAKITGDMVPLYIYLFRRPIAALRQRLGW